MHLPKAKSIITKKVFLNLIQKFLLLGYYSIIPTIETGVNNFVTQVSTKQTTCKKKKKSKNKYNKLRKFFNIFLKK